MVAGQPLRTDMRHDPSPAEWCKRQPLCKPLCPGGLLTSCKLHRALNCVHTSRGTRWCWGTASFPCSLVSCPFLAMPVHRLSGSQRSHSLERRLGHGAHQPSSQTQPLGILHTCKIQNQLSVATFLKHQPFKERMTLIILLVL